MDWENGYFDLLIIKFEYEAIRYDIDINWLSAVDTLDLDSALGRETFTPNRKIWRPTYFIYVFITELTNINKERFYVCGLVKPKIILLHLCLEVDCS